MNGITDVLSLSPEGLDWQKDRRCDEADPELFFPERSSDLAQIEEAKQVCRPCPVQSECLELALKNNAEGVWGGTSDDDRDTIRRRARQAVARRNFIVA